MWRKLVGKTVYIRLSEQDNAFTATVRYGCLYQRLEAWLVERTTRAGASCVNPRSNRLEGRPQ